MKKTIFSVALVVIMGLALASCQNNTLDSLENGTLKTRAAASYTADNVEGDYVGTLDKVIMNGKEKNPVKDQTISIYASGTNKIDVYLPPTQFGKMPGSITIDAKNITLNADGTFTTSNLNDAVILKLLGVNHYYKATLVTGKFTKSGDKYKLQFGLDTEGKFGSIKVFTAHVHFTGTK